MNSWPCSPIVSSCLFLRFSAERQMITRSFISLFLHRAFLFIVAWSLASPSAGQYHLYLPSILHRSLGSTPRFEHLSHTHTYLTFVFAESRLPFIIAQYVRVYFGALGDANARHQYASHVHIKDESRGLDCCDKCFGAHFRPGFFSYSRIYSILQSPLEAG